MYSRGWPRANALSLEAEFRKIQIAQLHHQLVIEAIEARESARVEMLMREHAWVGFRYGRWFGLESPRYGAGSGPAMAPSRTRRSGGGAGFPGA